MAVRAAVQTDDRKIEIGTFPLPSDLMPGEALLEVEGCGMCGSDVSQYEGVFGRGSKAALGPIRYPNIPGHEPVGTIAQITPEAAKAWEVDVGDRVAVHPVVRCGRCRNCTRGVGLCATQAVYGFVSAELGSGLHGGYAQYLHLRPESVLFKIDRELPIQDAVFYNPLSAGFTWAIQAAGTEAGDSILVLGPGQRGLASVIAAREAGAETIIVTGLSRDKHKLELALRLGATHAINAEDHDVVEAVQEITDGKGVDRAVDVTIRRKPAGRPTSPMPPGDPRAPGAEPVNVAVAAAGSGATIVMAGHKGGGTIPDFPAEAVIAKRLRIQGIGEPSAWSVEQAIRVIESRRYHLEQLHTHTITIDELDRGIRTLAGEVPGEDAIHITVTPT